MLHKVHTMKCSINWAVNSLNKLEYENMIAREQEFAFFSASTSSISIPPSHINISLYLKRFSEELGWSNIKKWESLKTSNSGIPSKEEFPLEESMIWSICIIHKIDLLWCKAMSMECNVLSKESRKMRTYIHIFFHMHNKTP